MFDFGLSYYHMLVFGVLAFMVIGKDDLPIVLRKFGQMMNKMRGMAREFQGHVDLAMKDAGVANLKADLQGLKSSVDKSISTSPPYAANSKSIASISPKVVDFEKFFGSETEGETIVAGKSLKSEAVSNL